MVELDLAALSHPGHVRHNNEDHFFVARFDRSMRTLRTNLREGEVPRQYSETAYGMLVADGVGGAAGGRDRQPHRDPRPLDLVIETPGLDHAPGRASRPARSFSAWSAASSRSATSWSSKAKADPSLRGMATTMTVACQLSGRSS